MKVFFLTLLIGLFFEASTAAVTITGVVRERKTNYPWANATILFYQSNKLVYKTRTNSFGEFKANLHKGSCLVRIKLPDSTWLKATKTIHHPFYWVIYHEPFKPFPVRNRKEKGKTLISGMEISTHDFIARDKTSLAMPAGAARMSMSMEDYSLPTTIPGEAVKGPKAGLLTAGEINDFQKWRLWEDLNHTEWSLHKQVWKVNPAQRYTVQLRNESNQPVSDIVVKLIGMNERTIWTARTDNTGKAELWENIFEDSAPAKAVRIDVYHATKIIPIKQIVPQQQGVNALILGDKCNNQTAVDIAFVVDATGSMGDEIQYLKEEMKDVIEQVAKSNESLDIQTGSVFYRDLGDEYVTRTHPFNRDINTTREFIRSQEAGGGGDFPEAVDAALAVAIRELAWRDNTVAKIMFVVLDAPPHADSDIVNRMHDLIREAAANGIRIVPVASSGIDKSTEFVLRSLALGTNGTYTFLTDHSGIGDKHLKPSTDSFKVELLNELMIRLIKQFTYLPPCTTTNKKDTTTINQENPFNLYDVTDIMKVYPNPASIFCMVQVPDQTEEMYLTDINGKLLEQLKFNGVKEIQISLVQYPTGIYFIRCKKEDKWMVEKLIISK